MDELLQKHGCANVFTVPDGLKELMADISREVLRQQPTKIFDFIANYLSVLMITREHGILAVRILDDLCDCRPSVSEHLLQLGMEQEQAQAIAQVIKEEIESSEPGSEGKAKVKESQIVKKALTKTALDEEMSAKVCQVARNAYKDYWYRRKLLEQSLDIHPEEPWEIAAEHTLQLYKSTKPSFSELNRATLKIQAAYKGYHVRRKLLKHLKLKPSKHYRPKAELPGPPLDVASSREIHLGPVTNVEVSEQNIGEMFRQDTHQKLGLQYDTTKNVTHKEETDSAHHMFDLRSSIKPPSTLLEVTLERRRRRSISLTPPDDENAEVKRRSEYGESKTQSPESAHSRPSLQPSHPDSRAEDGLEHEVSRDEIQDDFLSPADVPEDIAGNLAVDGDDEVESVKTASVASTAADMEYISDVDHVDTSTGEEDG